MNKTEGIAEPLLALESDYFFINRITDMTIGIRLNNLQNIQICESNKTSTWTKDKRFPLFIFIKIAQTCLGRLVVESWFSEFYSVQAVISNNRTMVQGNSSILSCFLSFYQSNSPLILTFIPLSSVLTSNHAQELIEK